MCWRCSVPCTLGNSNRASNSSAQLIPNHFSEHISNNIPNQLTFLAAITDTFTDSNHESQPLCNISSVLFAKSNTFYKTFDYPKYESNILAKFATYFISDSDTNRFAFRRTNWPTGARYIDPNSDTSTSTKSGTNGDKGTSYKLKELQSTVCWQMGVSTQERVVSVRVEDSHMDSKKRQIVPHRLCKEAHASLLRVESSNTQMWSHRALRAACLSCK